MTVQFNHKESGAWDVLTKSLIDAGFEITGEQREKVAPIASVARSRQDILVTNWCYAR